MLHIASGIQFVNHDITSVMFNYMDSDYQYRIRVGEIQTGNNVFIGANSTVLYDVRISDNIIIVAGSAITKNISSDCIAADVPCRIIGRSKDYQKKRRNYETCRTG